MSLTFVGVIGGQKSNFAGAGWWLSSQAVLCNVGPTWEGPGFVIQAD